MNRTLTFFLLLILLMGAATAGAFDMRMSGDTLTLHAEQVPLRDILEQVAALGIKVRMDLELNPTITASFDDREIQKGFDSLLRGLNYVLIWESIQGPLGPILRLGGIEIFRPGKQEMMRSLGRRFNLPVTRNPKDGSMYVKDEILLRLKKGAVLQDLQRLLAMIRGTVLDGNPGLGIYRVRLPEGTDIPALAEVLRGTADVAGAEPNFAYPLPTPFEGPDTPLPALSYFDARAPQKGVPVAVIDSGLMPDAGLDNLVLASMDALFPDQRISDALGHGTQMALIASGVVRPFGVRADPEMQTPIIPIRAFDEQGFTSNFLIMGGIDFALRNGARVMSLSWGSETKSAFLEEAFAQAGTKGLIIVASAGNEPTGRPVYPAAYGSVIGVGATGPDGKPWEKSNYGDFVSLSAPGFAALPVGYKGDPGTYAGTSISAAFVANLMANILSHNPRASRDEVIKALSGRQ
ncbi:MAG: S8 family serine peptidase [Desulfobacterales bacterium]|nr:S8 family serine peptidase [Desulfobacterales bacterium]